MSEEVLRACAAGEISPQIAVARLVLSGATVDPEALAARVGGEPAGSPLREVAELAAAHAPRLARLGRVAAGGLDPEGPDLLAATAALFDRLAGEEPEAAVAFYSLGDPTLLVPHLDDVAAVDALVVALDSLLSDDAMRERLGVQARRRAEQGYDLARVRDAYLDVWQTSRSGRAVSESS